MSISYSSVFASFNRQKVATAAHKNAFEATQEIVNFAKKVKDEISQTMNSGYDFNWENDPRRELLERLYELEEFKEFEKVYRFTNPQHAVPLIQKIEQHHSNSQHELELKRNIYLKKKAELEESHNNLLRTISQLGQAMSTLIR